MIGQVFLDSGAFTLQKKALAFGNERSYYCTPEYRGFLDAYAQFVKENSHLIDHYANLDAIGYADLSWRNLKYLENKHGLKPVPIFHETEPMHWLQKMLDGGYQYIGLGGLSLMSAASLKAGKNASNKTARKNWLNSCFRMICGNDGLPTVRVHGFGVGDVATIFRYPWWSVDTATWRMVAAMGKILVPRPLRNGWDFTKAPHEVAVTKRTKKPRVGLWHDKVGGASKSTVLKWLTEIGFELGQLIEDGKARSFANLCYYTRLAAAVPPWPRVFKCVRGFCV